MVAQHHGIDTHVGEQARLLFPLELGEVESALEGITTVEHHEVAAFVGGLAAQLVQLELQTGIAAQFGVELEQLLAGGLDGQRIFGRVEVGVGIIDMGNGQIQRNMLLAAVF